MNFFLIAHTRTGTTYLRDLLNSHPYINAYGEILYPDIFRWGFYRLWMEKIQNEGNQNLFFPHGPRNVFADLINELLEKSPNKTVGFDLKIPQLLDFPVLHEVIIQKRFAVIHLVRKNILKQLVSEKIMYQRILSKDCEVHKTYTPKIEKIEIDCLSLLQELRDIETGNNIIE